MPKIIGPPRVNFNLFTNNSEEPQLVILYYSYRRGVRFKFSIGWKISPLYWDRKKQRAKASMHYPQAAELNAYIKKLEGYCLDIYEDHNKGKISPDEFREVLNARLREDVPEDKAPITFLDFVEQEYKQRAKSPTAKKGSLQVLHKVLMHLEKYAAEKGKKLRFTELNERFYTDFRDWLHSPPRELSTNYVQKIFQNLKYFIRKAENRHLHNDRSYREFNPPKAPVSKIVLSFEQLEGLLSLEFPGAPHLEKARDLFLIGAYSGQRFGDFSRIRPEHITEHREQRIIELLTQKTEQTVFIPLHPILDAVLKKYGYTSPKMANQKMNEYLKEIGKAAGLTKEISVSKSRGGVTVQKMVPMWQMLTTHVARRSFATNYYQKHPELIDSIMKITGHTTEKMFRAYIVTDAKDSALRFAQGIKSK